VPESSDQGVGEEEGSTGVPIPGSPGLGRRRSGGVTMVKAAVEERSTRAHSGRGERERRGVGGADARAPFYRVGGRAGRLGIGEERTVVVACHNGDEGSRFGRGSTRE
jgi:hypothetical protein